MKGYIYIASAFQSLVSCGCTKGNQIDNDPHIWGRGPYTWGICRWDRRKCVNPGDYIFFVLGATAELPQMIFAYIRVEKVISHLQAFNTQELRGKRMEKSKNPNGNIIVDYNGGYNRYDAGVHKERFNEIKKYYVVADMKNSRKLSSNEIERKSKNFIPLLEKVFRKKGKKPIDFIYRGGRRLDEKQIEIILHWLK